jgi:hypothetical protein
LRPERALPDSRLGRARAGIARACLIGALLPMATLAACGGEDKSGPVGSADNPATPRATGPSIEATGAPGGKGATASGSNVVPTGPQQADPSAPGAKPGYRELVGGQTSKPKARFTPCALVTKAQAQAILGTTLLEPQEAAQGPTCIYRSRSGKQFVTLALQSADFDKLRPQLKHRRRITISDRIGYCGTYGRPILYLPLSGDRVLSVSAPCDTARQFAVRAVPRL